MALSDNLLLARITTEISKTGLRTKKLEPKSKEEWVKICEEEKTKLWLKIPETESTEVWIKLLDDKNTELWLKISDWVKTELGEKVKFGENCSLSVKRIVGQPGTGTVSGGIILYKLQISYLSVGAGKLIDSTFVIERTAEPSPRNFGFVTSMKEFDLPKEFHQFVFCKQQTEYLLNS